MVNNNFQQNKLFEAQTLYGCFSFCCLGFTGGLHVATTQTEEDAVPRLGKR